MAITLTTPLYSNEKKKTLKVSTSYFPPRVEERMSGLHLRICGMLTCHASSAAATPRSLSLYKPALRVCPRFDIIFKAQGTSSACTSYQQRDIHPIPDS